MLECRLLNGASTDLTMSCILFEGNEGDARTLLQSQFHFAETYITVVVMHNSDINIHAVKCDNDYPSCNIYVDIFILCQLSRHNDDTWYNEGKSMIP